MLSLCASAGADNRLVKSGTRMKRSASVAPSTLRGAKPGDHAIGMSREVGKADLGGRRTGLCIRRGAGGLVAYSGHGDNGDDGEHGTGKYG
jgi:hypothetical protein